MESKGGLATPEKSDITTISVLIDDYRFPNVIARLVDDYIGKPIQGRLLHEIHAAPNEIPYLTSYGRLDHNLTSSNSMVYVVFNDTKGMRLMRINIITQEVNYVELEMTQLDIYNRIRVLNTHYNEKMNERGV